MREEASIRVPDGTDPIDVIDPDKTEKRVIQASTRGGQYTLELCESEKHARRVGKGDDAMPNCDVLAIGDYIDGEHWRGVDVELSSSVRLDVNNKLQAKGYLHE